MARVWQSGNEDVIDYLERLLINVSVDPRWAVDMVGVRPRPLPGSGPTAGTGIFVRGSGSGRC
jgi:hypothetical protein